jgi:hypothetical protein
VQMLVLPPVALQSHASQEHIIRNEFIVNQKQICWSGHPQQTSCCGLLERSLHWECSAKRQVFIESFINGSNEEIQCSTSGRQKTCSHQNDIVWTLFDPLSTTFIHF